MHPDHLILNDGRGTPPVLSRSEMITPTKSRVVGSSADLAAGCSAARTQAPGDVDSGSLPQPGHLTSEVLAGKSHAPGMFQKSSHPPTPQSPGNMASYLLTRAPSSMQNSFQPDLDSTALPTEFPSHMSSSPPFRPHSIPTPEPSPLVARSRGNGQHSLAQGSRTSNHDEDWLYSRTSTPSWEMSTRPVTPVLQSRPTTPLQRRQAERLSRLDNLPSNDPVSQRMRVNPGAELCQPDYSKRMSRLAPPSSARAGGGSLTSEPGGQDGSLLWSPANLGIIEKGKRIALFQETSEESFEESLMAGGYGRYRSNRPWKLDESAELPNQLGDAMEEEELRPSLILTEEEKRKKHRLAVFLDPLRVTSPVTQLFPVEIEGRGRVLMKVEPSEPQILPKPTPKAKRSRKRKKPSADMKQDIDKDSTAAPEDGTVDRPNWPDTEFPWRCRLVAQDGLSTAEREERVRYIESFLDRDSDEDDVEEGRSPPSPRSLDVEASSRSSRPGRGKTYPLLSYPKGRRRGTATLFVTPSDPADAKTALLSKKSVRDAHLRVLRRRGTNHGADHEDDEVLCICRGRDDGRPLVQCDACRTWYHLECIGIQSTSELGREEDPWFCANCAEVKTPPPVVVPMYVPTLVPADDGEHGAGGRGGTDVERYDPPFLNSGLNPSPATPWTRLLRPPTTPPRTEHAPQSATGSSWDGPPSSSSRGDPRTPQFNTASAFGDLVRVYGMTPGRSLEGSSMAVADESPFDPTSTPSRGIRFGQPFATPKDGRWGSTLWQGVRSSAGGHELFHTPKQLGEDGGIAGSRSVQPLLYHGRVGEVSEEGPSGASGSNRVTGPNNVTPVERDALGGLRRMQVLESPLGGKRPRRTVDS